MNNIVLLLRSFGTSGLRRRLAGAVMGFALTGLLCSSGQAQLALPIYESFPGYYTNGGAAITVNGVSWPGTGLRQSGIPSTAVWTYGGTGNGNPTNIGAAALSYPGLYQTNGSAGLYMSALNITGGRTAALAMTPVSSGKLYASFLLNVQAWPVAVNRPLVLMNSSPSLGGADEFGFYLSGTNVTPGVSNCVYVVKHGTYANMSVSNIPPAAPSITAGTTHLICGWIPAPWA
jgi:hypothetical protein